MKSNVKYKNFLWDFDGTLFDTYDFLAISLKKALEEVGINASISDVMEKIKVSVSFALSFYAGEDEIIREKISNGYKKFSRDFDYSMIRPFDGTFGVLEKIKKHGGKNYIVTHRGESTLRLLEHFGFEQFFDEIVDSTYGFARKPSPDSAVYLIEKYNIDRSKTIFVGDRELDILCGKSAGISSCFFGNEKCDEADFNVKNYEEFEKLFL